MSDTLKRAEELLAGALAHRACCGTEHDPATEKLHGYCVVCGVPWPCDTAKSFMPYSEAEVKALREERDRLQRLGDQFAWIESDGNYQRMNAELTSLRGVVEKVRDYAELLSLKGDYAGSGNILSLLPEVPK